MSASTLTGQDHIGVAVGKVINKYKMAKHFQLHITDNTFSFTRHSAKIDAEAALDGIYVIRTSVTADTLDSTEVVTAYKALSKVERDFRIIKADDLDLRPIRHYLADRVKAHILICLLAAYLTWHLRHTLAPLTYTDHTPPPRTNPVTPAHVSADAARKASRHTDPDGNPVRSFGSLLRHMATLTRNTITHNGHTFNKITPPRNAPSTSSAHIPLSLT